MKIMIRDIQPCADKHRLMTLGFYPGRVIKRIDVRQDKSIFDFGGSSRIAISHTLTSQLILHYENEEREYR